MSSSGCSTPRSGPAPLRDELLLSDSSSSLSDAAASDSEDAHSLAPAAGRTMPSTPQKQASAPIMRQKQASASSTPVRSTPQKQAPVRSTPQKQASASSTPEQKKRRGGKITSDYAPPRPRRSAQATGHVGALQFLGNTVVSAADSRRRLEEEKRLAREQGRKIVRGWGYELVAPSEPGLGAAAESGAASTSAIDDGAGGHSTSSSSADDAAVESSTSTSANDGAAAERSTLASAADAAVADVRTCTPAAGGVAAGSRASTPAIVHAAAHSGASPSVIGRAAAESSASASAAAGAAFKRLAVASPTPEPSMGDSSMRSSASASALEKRKRRPEPSSSVKLPELVHVLSDSDDEENPATRPRKKLVRPHRQIVISEDEQDSSQLSDAPSEASVARRMVDHDSDSDEPMETSATSQSSTERNAEKRRRLVSFAEPSLSSKAAGASPRSAAAQSPPRASPARSRSRGQKVIDYSQTNHPPEAFSDSDEAGPSRKKSKAASLKTQKKIATSSPKAQRAPTAARPKSSTVTKGESSVRQRALKARETLADGSIVERQFLSCKSPRYAAHTRCIQCIKKQGNDGCRFQGIRVFTLRAAPTPAAAPETAAPGPETAGATTTTAPPSEATASQVTPPDQAAPPLPTAASDQSLLDLIGDPFFLSQSGAEELPDFPLSADLNQPMDARSARLILSTAARHLQPLLEAEIEHAKLPGCLRRSRVLADALTCDFCSTSLFSSSYFCDTCGYELCTECIETLRALGDQPKAEGLAACTSKKDAENKFKRRAHPVARFVPVTRSDTAELQVELQAMQEAVADAWVDGPAPAASTDGPGASTPASPASMPSHVVSHQVARLKMDSMDEDGFLAVWAHGQPLVVEGVTPVEVWDPAKFIAMHGAEECMIVRCDKDGGEKIVTVARFFETFGLPPDEKRELLGSGIWKLKDWPPSAEFAQAFPLLNADFNQSVPMPDFTRRDGRKNIAALFPANGNAPDLGPKMYNAWPGQLTEGGKGSTRLHMDVADAVNIMLHAAEPPTPDAPRAAAWDLFRTQDAGVLRQFLREKFSLSADGVDPIHTQQHYLDETLLAELHVKHGIKPWRVYQQQGEAVFIPAGCAHQVCNLTDCIKVAVDFISPHSVGRCFQLTQEFRGMSEGNKKSWKQDILQLRAQLWFAWRALRTLEEREAAAAAAAAAKLASVDSKPAEGHQADKQAAGAQSTDAALAAPPSLPEPLAAIKQGSRLPDAPAASKPEATPPPPTLLLNADTVAA